MFNTKLIAAYKTTLSIHNKTLHTIVQTVSSIW